jgi:hypothetical protein
MYGCEVSNRSGHGLVMPAKKPPAATAPQPSQRVDRTGPDIRDRMVDGLLKLGWQRRRPTHGPAASCDDQVPLHVERPLARRLPGRAGSYLVVDIVVQLVDAHVAVLVTVGVARLEAFHERAGEHRRRRVPGIGQIGSVEGVLQRVGGGDDHPPAPAELLLDVEVRARPR